MNMTDGGTDNPGVRSQSDDAGESWHNSVAVARMGKAAFNEPSKGSTTQGARHSFYLEFPQAFRFIIRSRVYLMQAKRVLKYTVTKH